MASDIIAAVTCVAEFTVAPIVKQVKHVLDYKQNLTNLPKEVEKLMDLKLEVQGLVSSAERNAEPIKPSVQAWIEEADQIAEAARQMIREEEEEEESKKRCFIGLCPDPVSRHRSSRKAFKETEQILQVQKAGREFKEGSVSFPVSAVPSFPVTATLGKDFLDFSSRSKTWEEIMEALKDPGANVIGVYGMGGLGKTTLVNQAAARAAEEKLFDEVVMPLVTQKNVLDVKEFQGEMAKVLGMKLDDQWNQWNVTQRADRIFKRLTQKKTGDEKTEDKTLVILDDLRAKLDLEQVGLPFGDAIKGCKILFTSRFQDISYTSQKIITLGVLEEADSWRLFQKIAGDVTKDQDFFNIGEQVAKNCKGLPILIVTVAGTLLQRRSLGAWKNALTNLQQEGSRTMQEFVDSALEFISFNHLGDANKSLFLLCGLLGGGEIFIFDQLLKLGIGWGLFKHLKTMEEARNNLETLILDLKASFLLLDGQSADTIRVHDVVRDVAIKIASNEEHNMLVGSSDNWPEEDVLTRSTALTFPYGIVPQLPECLEFPSLKFLLLYHNHSSLKIRDNLFEKMQKLTTLDVRSIDLSPKLPSSFAFLENLHTLSLNGCKLRDISIVGALKKLKILSLNRAGIVELPMEIGNLSELRVLDLCGCFELKVIPSGIIQHLSRLEELHLVESFSQWEADGPASKEGRNASLDELNYLVNLTTLRIHIPGTKFLPRDFHFEKLERFMILIGDKKWDWSCQDESLVLSDLPQLQNLCMGLFMANSSFSKLKYMDVNSCNNLETLFSFSMARGLVNLEEVKVTNCVSLKTVVENTREDDKKGDNVIDTLEFPQLRSLSLKRLPKLASFCNSDTSSSIFPNRSKLVTVHDTGSYEVCSEDGCTIVVPFFREKVLFPKLKGLTLEECDNMEYLFNQSIVMGLEQLNFMTIRNCKSLKGIVARVKEGEGNATIEFPRLDYLSLQKLPCLTKFYSGCSVVFPTLKQLSINGCQELKTFVRTNTVREDNTMTNQPLFNDKVSFPKLEELTLGECDNMEYLFNQSIVMCLEQLNVMTIAKCKLLKGIIGQVEEGEETNKSIKFPQLHYLSLEMLPCLARFCSGYSVVFPSLKQLSLRGCRKLKTFVQTDTVTEDKTMASKNLMSLFNEKVELPNLKELYIWDLDSVESICHSRIHEDSFFKLKRVDMRSCPNLVKIFSSTMLRRIQNLKELRLWDNCLVEEVFGNDERTKPEISRGGETTEDKITFSQLRFLELVNLSTMKRFCSGSCVEFPALMNLDIWDCEQIETFMYPVGVEDMDPNDMQPLFNEKVEFPSMKQLGLGKLDSIKIIWDGRIHEDSFSTLEVLTIWKCSNLLRIFPSVKIRSEFSTAKGWVQLATLSVTRCQAMKEIAASDSAADEIVFSKLKTLDLVELPGLVNFCLGNCVLKFPLLEDVTVIECNNMKAFCGGITVTPKLKTLSLTNEMDFDTIIKEGDRLAIESPTSSSEHLSEAEDDTCENSNEPRTNKSQISTAILKQDRRVETCEDAVKCSQEVVEANDKATNSSVEAESSEKIIEPRKEEIDTCKDARNEAHLLKETQGSLAPTPDNVDVTCPSSQSHPALGSGIGATTCQQNNDFHGLQVAQHLVPLLEKARDKHGDFHNSPSIKSKAVRIVAMESVGQVLHILQTQTPRTINAEKIQFMEDAFHDVSNMSFPIEWLHPLIDKASECLQRKEKIDEMEAQVQALKREIEKALVDLDQPLLDF